MTTATWPLVSICIPVYRAGGFVDNIAWNVENIEYPNLEFIISDRHLLDDAVERLRERFNGDDRVRFVTADDEGSWLDNFNLVVSLARGKYYRWLAQDDRLIGGLEDAVAVLESDPSAVVAYGGIELVAMSGRSLSPGRSGMGWRCSRGDRWGVGQSLLVAGNLCHREAVVGLVRRSVVIDGRLEIRRTHRAEGRASGSWLFGMSLAGRFRFVDAYRSQKGVHAENTGASWKVGWRHYWSYYRVAHSYLRDAPTGRPGRWLVAVLLPAFCLGVFPATVVGHRLRARGRAARRERG